MPKTKSVPMRSAVKLEDTWDLTKLFSSDAAWERGYKKLEKMMKQRWFMSLKQKLNSLSLKMIFPNLSKEYALYLIKEIERIDKIDKVLYENNLLYDGDSTHFYEEIGKLISLIEKKIQFSFLGVFIQIKLIILEYGYNCFI